MSREEPSTSQKKASEGAKKGVSGETNELSQKGLLDGVADHKSEHRVTTRVIRVEETREEPRMSLLDNPLEVIRKTMLNLFDRLSLTEPRASQHLPRKTVISDLSFDGFIKHWKNVGFKKVITMVGAGISTSAGIPDFRTPGEGLYSKLEKYNLPHPQAIFELDFFIDKPQPFFTLAKELYPGNFVPTPTHYFIRLLHEKGLLVRHYTQNIDMLERVAGIPEEKLVEAHGTFYTNHCVECKKEHSKEWMKEKIFSDTLPLCEDCAAVVKPDIVFFGENLNPRFYELPTKDFQHCDLLIIMGTSLEVQPFASLTDYPKKDCVRVVINREKIDTDETLTEVTSRSQSLMFNSSSNTRDIAFIGDCDDAIWKIAEGLGWTQELQALIAKEAKLLVKEPIATTVSKISLKEGSHSRVKIND